jgi:YD repeat-containing protein
MLRLVAVVFALAWSAAAQAQDGKWYHWYPYAQGDFANYGFGDSRAEVCAKLIGPAVAVSVSPSIRDKIVYMGMLPAPYTNDCGYQWNNNGHIVNSGLLPQFFATCADINTWNAGNATPEECLIPCTQDQKEADGTCRVRSEKQAGCTEEEPSCGNPVRPSTGNKFLSETDLASAGANHLSLRRVYNSGRPVLTRSFGRRWQHNFSSRIMLEPSTGKATYHRSDGKQLVFVLQPSSGLWLPDADVADRLVELKVLKPYRTHWKYRVAATDEVQTFDASGVLLSIENRAGLRTTLTYSDGTNGSVSGNGGFVLDAQGNPTSTVLPWGLLLRVADAFGRTLVFGYDASSRIVKITDPAGGAILYGFDAAHNLTSVTYQDGRQRQYLYNEQAHTGGANLPNALTGIIDENGDRFATYGYDSYGRATKTTHLAGALEVNRHLLTYDVSGAQTTVVDSLGASRPYTFQTLLGVDRNTGLTQPAASGTGTASSSRTFDANGNVATRVDWNGNRTDHLHDLARNTEIRRVEALTSSGTSTPQTRTISTQWHPVFRLPVAVAEPLRTTSHVYNGDLGASCGFKADGVTPVPGVPCSKTIQATSDATGSASSTIGTLSIPVTWTKATIGTCHNQSCSPSFTDIAYVYGNDPAGACVAAQTLTFWPALLEPGGASGSGTSGNCLYRHQTNNTYHNQGTWEIVTGCVSGTYPNQVFTASGSGSCVHTPPSGTLRTWSYTFNQNGNVLTINGPRTDVADVTTFTYFANNHADLGKRGNIATITNAAGHTTNITAYNAHGQPLTIVDPNGLTTTMTYDARLRLRTRTVGTETTTFDYDFAGNLTKVTLPDSSFLSYSFDSAHRLTTIEDNLGNKISYTLDAMGNRTAEEVRDPANQLAHTPMTTRAMSSRSRTRSIESPPISSMRSTG